MMAATPTVGDTRACTHITITINSNGATSSTATVREYTVLVGTLDDVFYIIPPFPSLSKPKVLKRPAQYLGAIVPYPAPRRSCIAPVLWDRRPIRQPGHRDTRRMARKRWLRSLTLRPNLV